MNEVPEVPDWLRKIALKVHDLIRDPHALGRFHVMIKRWNDRSNTQEEENRKWREKRKRHFKKLAALPADSPLRKEPIGPPGVSRGYKPPGLGYSIITREKVGKSAKKVSRW